MRFLVIDDDKCFLQQAKKKIEDNFVNSTCDTFTGFPPFYLLKDEYHVIMLDLLVGTQNGIDIAKKLKPKYPKAHFVCVSSKSELIFETQILGTLCFIRKQKFDYDFEVMKQLLCRCKGENKELILRLDNSNHIGFDNKIVKINTDDIVYAESYAHKITVVTLKGNYITNLTLKNFIDQVKDCGCFVQVHRACVLNMNYIYRLNNEDIEVIELKNSSNCIQIGRKYKKTLYEEFERFMLL